MSVACRANGLIGEAVCSGCRVDGFGEHDCIGEAIRTDSTGQAHISKCVCQVTPTCKNYSRPRVTHGINGVPL